MKTICNFINEKLTLNKQSKHWSIESAQNGDIITIEAKNTVIFMFDCIKKIKGKLHATFHCMYDEANDYLFIKSKNYELNVPLEALEQNIYKYYKSSSEQVYNIFDALKRKGYVWDSDKNELTRI